MIEFPYAPPAHLQYLAAGGAGPLTIPLDNPAATDKSIVGGKSANCAVLLQAGFPVPHGFAIPASAFESSIPDPEHLLQLVRDGNAKEAQDYVRRMPIPEEEFYRTFDREKLTKVAVRSSALAEDSAEQSFAGRYLTLLNQTRDGGGGQGDVGLIQAIRECWASFFGEVGMRYKQNVGSIDDLGMAVTVMEMVDPQSAGTAFTEDPTGHMYVRANTINVAAVPGLGEQLVSGERTPDTYRIDKHSGTVQQIEIFNGGVLSPTHVNQIAELAKSLEDHFQSPQDIEWAINGQNQVMLTQSRPITT